MMAEMATARTGKTPRGKVPAKVEGRKKSILTQVGDEAAREAKRTVLLAKLQECGWNLTRTGEALELGAASAVINAIRALGLEAEYEAARKRGDVAPGRPSE